MSKNSYVVGAALEALSDRQKNKIRAIDFRYAEELYAHKDVLEDARIVVLGARKVPLAFGYLIKPQTYLARAQRPSLPAIHLDIVVRGETSTDTGMMAYLEAFVWLLSYAKTFYKTHRSERLCLRVWCKKENRAEMGFYRECGFSQTDTMLHMVKDLKKDATKRKIRLKDGRFSTYEALAETVKEVDLSEETAMKRYIRYTKEAFGFPDSKEEMRFRIRYRGARVYTLNDAAFTTVWPIAKQSAATENVFTRPSAQGKGYMTQLLKTITWKLQKEGYETAELNVYAQDENAVRLYKKLGYKKQYEFAEMTVPVKDLQI